MTVPQRSSREAAAHATFSALLWGLAYPGRLQTSEHAGLGAIGSSLLDLETSFYTPDAGLHAVLARTGARAKGPSEADYLLYPRLDEADLGALRGAKRGELLYPDRAATLILGATFGTGTALRLRGPGLAEPWRVQVAGVPQGFWHVRNHARAYPLGWDVFLSDGAGVLGLPRSTDVELV